MMMNNEFGHFSSFCTAVVFVANILSQSRPKIYVTLSFSVFNKKKKEKRKRRVLLDCVKLAITIFFMLWMIATVCGR